MQDGDLDRALRTLNRLPPGARDADGKAGRTTATLENAWKAAPHPALWLAFGDLKTDETPRERALG